jgi:hypothetical protein
MDESQRLSVLLDDAKPTRTICSIGGFIYSSLNLVLDYLDNFIVDCGRDRDVALHPWRMRDSGDPDWREVFLLKLTALASIPYECKLMLADDPL